MGKIVKVNVRKALRQLLRDDGIIVAPGAYDAFGARLIEQAGFKAVFIGGGNVNAVMGYTDGEATRTEYLGRVREITDVLNLPTVVDIEAGFGSGSAPDLMRTIQECERVGIAAVHCEDQQPEVKTGGFRGGHVLPLNVMLKKIEAALEARQDPDFVFIARTDARKRHGMEEALKRGREYAKAGADMIVVTGLETVDELKNAVDHVGAPLLTFNGAARPGDVGANPLALSTRELQDIGVKMVTFGNGILRAVGKTIQEMLEEIKQTGTDKGFVDRMMMRKEMYELVGTPARDALRERFLDYK
jgi:2-methylisocitrate lyase-like PEP mutase family enzyme